MREAAPQDEIVSCKNCSKQLPPGSQFCPNCSQRYTTGKVKFTYLIGELIDNFFQWDARWLKTLKHLFWPGKLTKEFFLGRHRSYIHPIRIFLLAIALFIYLFSQFLAKNDDDHLIESDEFKIRLYKNYLLEEVDKLRQNSDGLSHQIADSLVQQIVQKVGHLENELKISGNATKLVSDSSSRATKGPALEVNSDRQLRRKTKEVDPYFYLKLDDKIQQCSKAEFERWPVAEFVRRHPVEVDTPQQYIVASLRKMKSEEDYNDTINFLKYIDPTDVLSFVTDWSDPLQVSVSLTGSETYAVALEDIRKLPVDQIVDKFKLENFIDRLLLKQLIKFNLDRKSFINFLLGTILWILLFFVPIMALVFKLFYIRQKRYYIEHVIYLLHYQTIVLITFSIMILLENYESGDWVQLLLLAYAALVLPIFGLKYYYRQSWLKTIIKGMLLGGIYVFMIFIFVFLGLTIGFFFY